MADSNFVHLHTHSHYSLLDCTATVEHLVDAAKAAGMPALAVTDHGNMFGCIEFYETATAAGIKPIVGYEAYVAPDSRLNKDSRSIGDASHHLTLLAQRRNRLPQPHAPRVHRLHRRLLLPPAHRQGGPLQRTATGSSASPAASPASWRICSSSTT